MATIEENVQRLGGFNLKHAGPPVPMTEQEVAGLERSLGVRLPENYRRFLLTYEMETFNGYIDFETLAPPRPWLSQETGWHFVRFFGDASKRHYSIASNIDSHRDRMLETLIPIGTDGFGNHICLGIAGPERGKIYFWDHEDEWDEDEYILQGKPVPPDLKFQNVHLIANSFEEFLDQMYVVEDV